MVLILVFQRFVLIEKCHKTKPRVSDVKQYYSDRNINQRTDMNLSYTGLTISIKLAHYKNFKIARKTKRTTLEMFNLIFLYQNQEIRRLM